MGPAFAAVGAGVAALLESTIVSRYQIVGAQLQMSLVFVIAATIVFGFEEGIVWAFVGGLCLDFFAMRPLGSSVFELLVAVALVMVTEPLLSRSRYAGCVLATLFVTPIFLIISDITTGLLRSSAPPLQLTGLVAAGVANAGVAAVLALLLIGIKRRAENRERVLWWR
jgi:cell shape-determining protein MreD